VERAPELEVIEGTAVGISCSSWARGNCYLEAFLENLCFPSSAPRSGNSRLAPKQ
jgi:hypothetical protein